jgi:hypothetical protein
MVMNVWEWASSRAEFDAAVRLAHETRCVLFGSCVDVGGTSLEEVKARDLHNLQNRYSALHARAGEDLAIIDEVAFVAAWMDVKAGDETWLSILQDILQMRENLDLWWISPSQNLMLGNRYSAASVGLLAFLNHVAGEKWSQVETAVDGETREIMNLGPVEINPEANATCEAAGATDVGTLPQPSSTVPSTSASTAVGKTGFGKGTLSWTQAIREGFLELLDGEVLPFVSQIDCEGLSQHLASMPVEPPVFVGVLEDNSLLTSDGKIETTANIAEVSRFVGSVPIGAATHPTSAPLTESNIVALLATRLQRYSQTMVWDIPVDKTEHLSKPVVMLVSLDPTRAMSSMGETTLDLEAELLWKTKIYS